MEKNFSTLLSIQKLRTSVKAGLKKDTEKYSYTRLSELSYVSEKNSFVKYEYLAPIKVVKILEKKTAAKSYRKVKGDNIRIYGSSLGLRLRYFTPGMYKRSSYAAKVPTVSVDH